MAMLTSALDSTASGLTPLQQEYLTAVKSQPKQSDLYEKYRKESKIGDQEAIVAGLDRSILDLEGKIKGVESNVNSRTQDFLVTDAQRQRRVAVEEQPLRDQYLESLRRRESANTTLNNLDRLINQRVQFAINDASSPLTALQKAVEFETQNKKTAADKFDFSSYFPKQTEAKPTTPGSTGTDFEPIIEAELGNIDPTKTPASNVITPEMKANSSKNVLSGGLNRDLFNVEPGSLQKKTTTSGLFSNIFKFLRR